MRLKKVKLSGFKSFVEPTTFVLTSKLNGIVGPNGCGKSNIIDAVRWVMGESSAKQLRGESMSDVIFNGSERRKPAGMASIELIFENDQGRLGGKWSEYREISIRRTLDRDGKSQYFLNNTRCRRRDITDIFLGTGLGPRSYAIIEQGMISRIVESKPDELRIFFEEAANISKYKERRHETEQRIEHTRENLERLNDIRLELGKQLTKLERQADAARRYQALREQERTIRYSQVTEQKRAIEADIEKLHQDHVGEYEQFQAVLAQYQEISAEIVVQKEHFETLEATLAERNRELYPYKQAVDHLNHEQIRLQDLQKQALESQSEWQENGERLSQELEVTTTELATLEENLTEEKLTLESLEEQLWQERDQLMTLEQSLESAEKRTQQLRDQVKQLEQKLQLARQSRQFHQERLTQVIAERETLELQDLSEEVPEASEESRALEASLVTYRKEQSELNTQIEVGDSELITLKAEIRGLQDQQRQELATRNQLAGEISMLQKMLNQDEKKSRSPLFEHLVVKEGWNSAVDTVLQQFLMVETEKQRGSSYMIGEHPYQYDSHQLGYYIESDIAMGSLLSHLYIFDDSHLDPFAVEKDAGFMARREKLALYEMIVTKSGLLFGPDWALYNTQDAQFGILARQRSLENAISERQAIDQKLEFLDETLYEKEEALKARQQLLDRARIALQKVNREYYDLEKKLSLLLQAESHQAEVRHRAKRRFDELVEEERKHQTQLAHLATEIRVAEEEQMLLQEQFEESLLQYEMQKSHYSEQKQQMEQLRESHRARKGQVDQLEHHFVRLKERHNRAEEELTLLQKRLKSQEKVGDYQDQIADLEVEKVIAIERLVTFESELKALEHEVEKGRIALTTLEERRNIFNSSLEALKKKMNQFSIREAEFNTKRAIILEQWEKIVSEISDEELLIAKEHYQSEKAEVLEEKLKEIQSAIQKMGAVNLMAIAESEELRERKEYLDTQHEDLETALSMLEKAIREIDQETRTRFMETFEAINDDFSTLFPRLFGGGKAYLELTEADALTSGINIIAHPPGKKPGTIHLLSGGEKALTAMALVFSIFNLNPAPFCMLDEVDAPLDEANVRRLGKLIDEMSEKVQFIFITHNKATMTISDSLIGVTMAEPGVSRLVSVNLQDAMAFSEE